LKFSDYNIEFDFKGKTLILTSIFQQRKDIQLKIYDLSGKQIYSEKFSFERKKILGYHFKSGKYF